MWKLASLSFYCLPVRCGLMLIQVPSMTTEFMIPLNSNSIPDKMAEPPPGNEQWAMSRPMKVAIFVFLSLRSFQVRDRPGHRRAKITLRTSYDTRKALLELIQLRPL